MSAREKGSTQEVAAAKAGFSERTARRIENRQSSPQPPRSRDWRTRSDPLEAVWQQDLVPLLEQSPTLMAVTLLEELQRKHPQQYPDSLLRTLQRRVKFWRAQHGPEKEIMFRQRHTPGQQGLSDFTQFKGVEITLNGQPFAHKLYHFRLAYSHWSYMRAVQGGESFTALAEGLQEALLCLGGAPMEHRTDSLSAAYRNLDPQARADLTQRYADLCQHYQMQPTRNNRGNGHENGAVEAAHGHLKRRIVQALELRGSYEFADIAEYQAFIERQVSRHNQRNRKLIDEERGSLQSLPNTRAVDYDEVQVRVTSSSTISLRKVTYSVPSQLIGSQLRVRCFDDRLHCYLGSELMLKLPRRHVRQGEPRAHVIDYRHMVAALERKPMAFYSAQLRDHILPTEQWRQLWQTMCTMLPPRQACHLIIQALKIAAERDDPDGVAKSLTHFLAEHDTPSPLLLQRYLKVPVAAMPQQHIKQHPLDDYDALLGGTRGGQHD